MANTRSFCGFFASVMIVFAAQNAFAAGYQCTKKYTSCNSGHYMTTAGSSSYVYQSSAVAGNACRSCPDDVTCPGGTAAPYVTATFNVGNATIKSAPTKQTTSLLDTQSPYTMGYSATPPLPSTDTFYYTNHYLQKYTTIYGGRSFDAPAGEETSISNFVDTTFDAVWASCPTGYPYSEGTGIGVTSCYRKCDDRDVPNAKSFSSTSKVMSNDNGTGDGSYKYCYVIRCNDGYLSKTSGEDCSIFTITLEHQGGTGTGLTNTLYTTANNCYLFTSSSLGTQSNDKNITLPTKRGYTLQGYYTEENGNGTQKLYNNGNRTNDRCSLVTVNTYAIATAPTKWYAHWTVNSYNITYKTNGGTLPANGCPATYTYGVGATIQCAPTKTGYTFAGWCTDEGLTQNCTMTKYIMADDIDDKTFYAKWTANNFTVNYDANRPDAASGTITNTDAIGIGTMCTYDSNCSIPASKKLELAGWTFVGWAKSKSDATNGIKLDNLNNLATGGTTTVYAIWTPKTFTFSLANNCQGSNSVNFTCENTTSATPSSIYEKYDYGWYANNTYTDDARITSLKSIPVQTGYTFDGFYDTNNTQVIDKNGNIIHTPTLAYTLAYQSLSAHWHANTYYVTFDQTGGTGGATPMNVIYDNTVKSVETPMRAGYTFTGYYADGVKYFDEYGNYVGHTSNKWRYAGNIELFAGWDDCPGGSYCDGTSSLAVSCDTLVRTPGEYDETNVTNPTRGYWNLSVKGADSADKCYRKCGQVNSDTRDGHGLLRCATNEYDSDGNCIAYHNNSCAYTAECDPGYEPVPRYKVTEIAQCDAASYDITFDPNGGTGDGVPLMHCTVDRTCRLPNVTQNNVDLLSRTGYVFTGWSTIPDGSEDVYTVGTDMVGTLNPTGSFTLYAIWGQCDKGFFWDNDRGVCDACPVDTFKTYVSDASGATQSCTACAAGEYIDSTANTADTCTTCPAGSYCDGNGIKPCEPYPTDDENYDKIIRASGTTHYTSGTGKSDINACYFNCPEFDVEYGHAIPKKANPVYYSDPKRCEYECVSITGNPGKVVNGVCRETSCRPEFEMDIHGKCTACFADNPEMRDLVVTYGKKDGRNCVIESCVAGYHVVNNGAECVPDEQECTAQIDGAIDAYQVWNGKTWGVCTPRECESNRHIEGNACVDDSIACTVENGAGIMEWDYVHNRWGECEVTKCNAGYTNDPYESNEPSKKCGECRNKYGIDGEVVVEPSQYVPNDKRTIECQIASCKDQGQRYNLEGNECVPICIDGYSDETGRMEWVPGIGCVITCEKSYTPWDGFSQIINGTHKGKFTPITK